MDRNTNQALLTNIRARANDCLSESPRLFNVYLMKSSASVVSVDHILSDQHWAVIFEVVEFVLPEVGVVSGGDIRASQWITVDGNNIDGKLRGRLRGSVRPYEGPSQEQLMATYTGYVGDLEAITESHNKQDTKYNLESNNCQHFAARVIYDLKYTLGDHAIDRTVEVINWNVAHDVLSVLVLDEFGAVQNRPNPILKGLGDTSGFFTVGGLALSWIGGWSAVVAAPGIWGVFGYTVTVASLPFLVGAGNLVAGLGIGGFAVRQFIVGNSTLSPSQGFKTFHTSQNDSSRSL